MSTCVQVLFAHYLIPEIIMGDFPVNLCTVQCTEDSIELNEGSKNSSYSLVEMCSGGKWMSVCDHTQWTKEDATTICRQVGHATNGISTSAFL